MQVMNKEIWDRERETKTEVARLMLENDQLKQASVVDGQNNARERALLQTVIEGLQARIGSLETEKKSASGVVSVLREKNSALEAMLQEATDSRHAEMDMMRDAIDKMQDQVQSGWRDERACLEAKKKTKKSKIKPSSLTRPFVAGAEPRPLEPGADKRSCDRGARGGIEAGYVWIADEGLRAGDRESPTGSKSGAATGSGPRLRLRTGHH